MCCDPGTAADPGVSASGQAVAGISVGVRDDPAVVCVAADPVSRPLASRYWVLAPPPELGWVIAVPMIRPEAFLVPAFTVPPAWF
jgi:hypothetical protein